LNVKLKIALASNNTKKLIELQSLLPPIYELQSIGDYDSPEETGTTFVENAIIKARHVAQLSHLPTIADDSGLEVDALKGQPGIYSSRFAGPSASDKDNNEKLLEDLAGVSPELRSARFQCVIVFLRHALDPMPVIAAGTWEGQILERPQGENGFGYDPLFFIPEMKKSSAELSSQEKNKVSHRAKALLDLYAQLSKT
jgi:XTP/dITP diphosphohydrolase